MEYATKKDIERASTLGDHSGATNLPRIKIARGKVFSDSDAALLSKVFKIETVATKKRPS